MYAFARVVREEAEPETPVISMERDIVRYMPERRDYNLENVDFIKFANFNIDRLDQDMVHFVKLWMRDGVRHFDKFLWFLGYQGNREDRYRIWHWCAMHIR